MARTVSNRNIPSLDRAALERLALRYVERFATTRFRLTSYLERKLYERGWDGPDAPPTAEIVERFSRLGYVNDPQFAEARAASLTRRGYGRHRVDLALRAAGIEQADAAATRAETADRGLEAAMNYARRRKIGPFGEDIKDPAVRKRAFAAMVRAGHPIDIVIKILNFRDDEDIAGR